MDALFGGAQTLFALSLTAFYKKVPSIPVRMCLNSLFFTVSMFYCLYASTKWRSSILDNLWLVSIK